MTLMMENEKPKFCGIVIQASTTCMAAWYRKCSPAACSNLALNTTMCGKYQSQDHSKREKKERNILQLLLVPHPRELGLVGFSASSGRAQTDLGDGCVILRGD